MKKIIGILAVCALMMTVFFNTSLIIENNANIDLVSLTTLSLANAENGNGGDKYNLKIPHSGETDVTIEYDHEGQICTATCDLSSWMECTGTGVISCTSSSASTYNCRDFSC